MDGITFTPASDDMEYTRYGLHVSSLGGPDALNEDLIVVGRDVTVRRATAALSAYTRELAGPIFAAESLQQLRADLARRVQVFATTPTAFTRTNDGGWVAHPHQEGAPLAVWLVSPDHAAAWPCGKAPDHDHPVLSGETLHDELMQDPDWVRAAKEVGILR
ncbi:hypothetical protein [Streptomyces poriferorum]|uniref:Uncharacterized protein n=1 Tax=Streptomyces poriferorum TaxID=2798799 RepID=A0ABY9J0J2_9ACTN|nr:MULTISPECIES: hypothetical protein [unclassified Streptomyces]MDP5310417.1 hypothetical protein [Streptomyces sp. Alt4]WLQ60429.1 hypothetical protein P8A19_35620 [Streptomyces sp. Alt2]